MAVRIVLGFVLAALVAIILACALNTQMVIAALEAAGASIPFDRRLGMTGGDLLGLAPQYGAVIAGAAAIAVALTAMKISFDGIEPIAGARGGLGLALQCLAGVVGGLVFASMARKRG